MVIRPQDADAVLKMAEDENLEATIVARVTDEGRMRLMWNGKTIVDITRDFLNSNGATQHAAARVEDVYKRQEKGRPGEGFYDDTEPQGVYVKVLSTARQAAEYPAMVTDVQYEVENFPYHDFQKSRRITLDECTLALAAGMNGVLLNTCLLYTSRCV